MGNLKRILEEETGEKIVGEADRTGKIQTVSGNVYFLKSGASSRTFQCEANGLRELAKPACIRIARVISAGENYILTEYIERGQPDNCFQREFGKQLARLHRYHSDTFGFYEDNFIGANPQINISTDKESTDWISFYFNNRLLYQYKLAEKNGYVTERLRSGFSHLERIIGDLLKDSVEPPTLLHGDLWSGNFLCDENGKAVLIDPAVYYGNREADLAMTKVFGGFSADFYKGYMEEFPLKEGWQQREGIYKLYHILNHLNIFGRSYLPEAEYIVAQ